MTDPSTSDVIAQAVERTLSQRIDALTDDQRAGLAHALYVAQWVNTVSYSRRLEHAEVEVLKLRGYSRGLYDAVCRIAQLPAKADESGREILLAHLEVERYGQQGAAGAPRGWPPRGRVAGERTEVHVMDQPAREVALAIALVQLARGVLSDGAGDALHRFNEALGSACDDLEEALYPEPPLEQKIATMRERHEASLAREHAEALELQAPEPSFHGSGPVD
jgi:hypothetical protein